MQRPLAGTMSGVREGSQQRHLLSTPTVLDEGPFMLIKVTSPLVFGALVYRMVKVWYKNLLMERVSPVQMRCPLSKTTAKTTRLTYLQNVVQETQGLCLHN